MPKSVSILKVFIASPSDVLQERNICCDVISRINSEVGDLYSIRFEPITWENNTYPAIGVDPQAVINSQVGDNYDIFVGIMWSRFGSDTGRAGSGTEEEFCRAFDAYEKGKLKNLFFYFSNQPVTLDLTDGKQIDKIKAFKSKISTMGVYYDTYSSEQQFSEHFRNHLSCFLKDKYKAEITIKQHEAHESKYSLVLAALNERLRRSLIFISNQPEIFIEPRLGKQDELSMNPDKDELLSFEELIESPKSYVVIAPPQFGATVLSHYIAKLQWERSKRFWVNIDCQNIKYHKIIKEIVSNAAELGFKKEDIQGIVLDSWNSSSKECTRALEIVDKEFSGLPIIVMHRNGAFKFNQTSAPISLERNLCNIYLMSLTREKMRHLVISYNKCARIGDESKVLNRIAADLTSLNIHRTPFNCMTLLKVCEKFAEEAPINRTQMLEMVLFILFNLDQLPTYKTKPDVKDCQHVLGVLCEHMLKNNKYEFSEKMFFSIIEEYCKRNYLEVDLSILFEILVQNQIIVEHQGLFYFKFSYWIFFFAAHRMYVDEEFQTFILAENRYISYPSIIEFYAGIDRNRKNVVEFLIVELSKSIQKVTDKVGLLGEMNPYKEIHWSPKPEDVKKITDDLDKEVQGSKLPSEVKDRFSDMTYDRTKPYNQSIEHILETFSVTTLMQQIKASSMALRNSDYVTPEAKLQMLSEIFKGWDQLTKVVLALSPMLAVKGIAEMDGANFVLVGEFGVSLEERWRKILLFLPRNVLRWFRDELSSQKLGALLFEQLKKEQNDLVRHQIALFIAAECPRHWKAALEFYISAVSKNSFYLYDIFSFLRTQYKYGTLGETETKSLIYLIKHSLAKHKFGKSAAQRIPDSVLPSKES